MNRKTQQTLRKLHFWAGLIAGTFITMMGLTGMVIVFRPVLENGAASRPKSESTSTTLAPMERSFAVSYPGTRITRVIFSEAAPGLLLVQAEADGNRRLQIYFDAASGQELRPKKTITWLDWLADLHQNLLMGKSGRALTGVIGIALFVLALSGIFSWLAGPRDWRRGFALPRKGPWRRTNYELHRWAGLWMNSLLLTISLTGIVLSYPDSFEKTIQLATGEPQLPRRLRTSGAQREMAARSLPLDVYLQAAVAVIPGGIVRELRLPSHSYPTITLWAPGDIRPKGDNVVTVDQTSARVITVDRSSNAPLSSRLVALANAVHKTELGGMPMKVAWSLLGLAPMLLFLSGLQIWWCRKPRSRRERAVRHETTATEVVGSAGK